MNLDQTHLLQLTTNIVVARVLKGNVRHEELPELIRSVFAAFSQPKPATPAGQPLVPAVPVEASVFPDYIVCLEDGKRFKTLMRHLGSAYGMTVDEYRTKWGLPSNYPVIAPNYAKHRSNLSKQIAISRDPGTASGGPKVQKVPERRRRSKALG